ncbi:hypothetical protein [Helicobacter sp.]|uniref:hypothetical protein n=1 Tax=Helicobacter sp. TaxID=218 RepID=UPI002A919175|nr:hypothetical protein [Helicobacter sp.]MDY5557027.1 hypothetical protein [Helicobacter sp.]
MLNPTSDSIIHCAIARKANHLVIARDSLESRGNPSFWIVFKLTTSSLRGMGKANDEAIYNLIFLSRFHCKSFFMQNYGFALKRVKKLTQMRATILHAESSNDEVVGKDGGISVLGVGGLRG